MCTLLLHSGLIDPPLTLLVMHECCMREAAVDEVEELAVSKGMRVAAFLLAAKVLNHLHAMQYPDIQSLDGFELLSHGGRGAVLGRGCRCAEEDEWRRQQHIRQS